MRTHACPAPASEAERMATWARAATWAPSDHRFCLHVFSIRSKEAPHVRGS
jgi:hypothetical protein